MTWLVTLGTSVLLVLSSLFAGTVRFFYHSTPPATAPSVATTTRIVTTATTTTPQAETPTPILTSDGYKSGYYRDSRTIYYYFGSYSVPVLGADPTTFAAIGNIITGGYAKDKNNVYLLGKPLPGIDPATFTFISTDVPIPTESDYPGAYATQAYAKDKWHVYSVDTGSIYPPTIIAGADSATFTPLFDTNNKITDYSKDKNTVYYLWTIISGADPATFVPVYASVGYWESIGKDNKNVYYSAWVSGPIGSGDQPQSSQISGADPETFAVIGSGQTGSYSKDKNHVYFGASVVQGADPETFILNLNTSIDARDKNHSYVNGQKVQ